MAKLSSELHQFFFEDLQAETVTLAEVADLFGERAFGVLFVLLALPSALPVPAPGYSVPFGILILSLSVQLVAGKQRPYFFGALKRRPLRVRAVRRFIQSGLPWLRRIEAIARPRWTPVCTSRVGRVAIGLLVSLMAISMMLPIPLTNTLPAIAVFVTGFGLLDDDGVISLGGLALCVLAALTTTAILVFGYEAVRAVINLMLGRG